MNSIQRHRTIRGHTAAPRNLVAYSEDVSTWTGSAGTSPPLGLNALGRFSGYALISNGESWHRKEFHEFAVVQAEPVCTTIWLRQGSSQSILFRVRDLDAQRSYTYSAALDALPDTMGGHTLFSDTLLADGISRKLTFTTLMDFSGLARMEIGPFSDVAQDDIIILAAQVERGDHPTAYQYKGLS